jgi:hypothetical protein
MRVRRLAALLLAAGGLAGVAAAQSGMVELSDLGLRASVESPWPDDLSRGYRPVLIDVENESGVDRTVKLELSWEGWRSDHRATRWVEVPAGTRRGTELFLPAFDRLWGGAYRIEMTAGGQDDEVYLSGAGGGYTGNSIQTVLLLSERDPPAKELDAWTQALASEEFDTGGQKTYDVSLAAVLPGDAPARFEAYTSIDLVVVDTAGGASARALEPVLSWARLGGTLAFLGPDAERVARALPDVAAWMEPRFQLTVDGEVYALAHGLLLIGEEAELFAGLDRETVRWALDEHPTYVPDLEDPPGFVRTLPIPGLRDLPYRLFILFLVLFAVVIGPVNFLLVKATGRPAWLLLTIPCLSGLAALLILAYGIFYQGIELKEASETFTVLDQREHRADTVALRSFFAGLAPTDGLRPGQATACFPLTERNTGETHLYRVDLTQGSLLTGEFLPVRREATQIVLSERAARTRLVFERDGEAIRCENALEVPLERLCLRGADGWYYGWNTAGDEGAREPAAAPGASVRLERLEDRPELKSWMPAPSGGRDLGWGYGLPRATYVAILSANPFADGCGLVPDQAAGDHVVIGVLEREQEAR